MLTRTRILAFKRYYCVLTNALDFPDTPEVCPISANWRPKHAWTEFFGTQEIAVKSVIEDPNMLTTGELH